MGWSDHALALFRERAIDPDVAEAAGVTEADGCLVYPTGKRRPLNGNGGPPHLHPEGEPVAPWPVGDKPAEVVLVTEGETDGLAARTALSSESPFTETPVLALPGCTYPADILARGLADKYRTRDAYLALDADEAGRRATAKITRALEARGIRAIPVELPDGLDLAAWLADGGDLANALADAEPAYTRQRQGVSFAEIAAERVEWLWRERIPLRELSVLVGDPGQGKSTFTCWLAAELSRAGMSVLMANADDSEGTMAAVLSDHDADLSLIRPIEGLVLPDVERLREQAIETGAKLITLDPWDAFLDDGVNQHKRREVYAVLKSIRAIARELNCAVLIVAHANLPGEDKNPIHRIPVGLRDKARAALGMFKGERVTELRHIKSRFGPEKETMRFHFDDGRLVEVGGGVPSPASAGESHRPAAANPSELPSIDEVVEQTGLEIVNEFDD